MTPAVANVFALWDSGTLIRAARVDAPEALVIGVVPAGDSAALVEAVENSRVEASGQRLSPGLEDIRRRAFDLALAA